MNHKDTIHYLRIIEIGKSKDLPSHVIDELTDRDLIELVFINDKPAFNGNHILTNEGAALLNSNRY
jgi:hypothetical protein